MSSCLSALPSPERFSKAVTTAELHLLLTGVPHACVPEKDGPWDYGAALTVETLLRKASPQCPSGGLHTGFPWHIAMALTVRLAAPDVHVGFIVGSREDVEAWHFLQGHRQFPTPGPPLAPARPRTNSSQPGPLLAALASSFGALWAKLPLFISLCRAASSRRSPLNFGPQASSEEQGAQVEFGQEEPSWCFPQLLLHFELSRNERSKELGVLGVQWHLGLTSCTSLSQGQEGCSQR